MEPWLDWIQKSFAAYGVGFVLIICLLENLLFTGAIIPGAVVLVIAGWLTRSEGLPVGPLILAGITGTAIGDTAGYLIGNRLRRTFLRSPWWRARIRQAARLLRRQTLLLALYHFTAYLRMIVPMTAGIIRVPITRWLILDFIGATLWVSMHVLAGYYLSPAAAERPIQVLGLLVSAGVLAYFVFLLRRSITSASRLERHTVDARRVDR